MRASSDELAVLEENDILLLGNLICDVEPTTYSKMTEDAFMAALGLMSSCLHR